MTEHQETFPKVVNEVIGDRRHELALETKTERGRAGLFRDRADRLQKKVAALQIALAERIAQGEKFDSAQVVEQLQSVAREAEQCTAISTESEERLRALEARTASIAAAFDQKHPERN